MPLVPEINSSDHLNYRPDIDGLRAIAVLFVVGFHALPKWISGGFIGVDIFFVISGFLISTIIYKKLAAGKFSYLEFYKKRIRRIFPALIVVIYTFIILGWFLLLSDEYLALGKHTIAAVSFISNFIFWSESGYFDVTAEAKPFLHLWSLAVEEQFYFLWPIFLVLAWKRKHLLIIISLLCFLSFILNVYLVDVDPTAAFYSPASRFWELMVGSVLALVMLRRVLFFERFGNYLSAIGLCFLVLSYILINKQTSFPGWWALLPTIGTAFILASGAKSWVNRRLLSNKILTWIGGISYSLYLWHWPLLSLAYLANDYAPLSSVTKLLLVLFAVFLSWLTTLKIERPIRFQNALQTSYLVGLFFLIGLFAAIIYANDGFLNRNINKDNEKNFINSYAKLHKFGLSKDYKENCDFYDWATGKNKGSIDEECTKHTVNKPLYLLWGDSHAQALSYGFKEAVGATIDLSQIATSGCKPELHTSKNNGANKAACIDSNKFAVQFIKDKRPQKVYVAQASEHELTDWEEISKFVKANNGELILIGPVPQWRPSLPALIAKELPTLPSNFKTGLDLEIIKTDALLIEKNIAGNYQYISLINSLCNEMGCLSTIDNGNKYNLLVLDYGHLTPSGSAYVANKIIFNRPHDAKSLLPPSK